MEQSFGVSLGFCGDGHKEGVTEKKKVSCVSQNPQVSKEIGPGARVERSYTTVLVEGERKQQYHSAFGN